MKFQDYVLSFFVGVVLVLFLSTIMQGKELQLQQEQLEHQDVVIQNLRNDLVDTQYYYDEYLRIHEIKEDAQDEMISRLFKYVLDEYNGELIETYITEQDLINMLESRLQSYYTKNDIKQILKDYDKITYDEYIEENNIFIDISANEVNIAFYNIDMSDVIYFTFIIELDEFYAFATYQGEIIFEDTDTNYRTKDEFILDLTEEIFDDKIDFYKVYSWYVE